MAVRSQRKISPELESKLKTARTDEPVEVIVQLEAPQIPDMGSRAERIDATKKTFDRAMADLMQRTSPGWKVLDTAWINSTARVLATPDQIRKLETDDTVQSIGAPATLQPE